MLGIEDVAGYSDFFSPDEWDAIVTGDWSSVTEEDWGDSFANEQSSSGVTVYGPDCAAQRDQVAPEDRLTAPSKQTHSAVVVTASEPTSNEDEYDIHCDTCGRLGAADTFEEAQAIARLHERFVAVPVDRWDES